MEADMNCFHRLSPEELYNLPSRQFFVYLIGLLGREHSVYRLWRDQRIASAERDDPIFAGEVSPEEADSMLLRAFSLNPKD